VEGPAIDSEAVTLLFATLLLPAAIAAIALIARRNYLSLPELPVSENTQPPDHVVIIPARGAALMLARAVDSFPQSEVVVVVDKRISDATALAAAAAGAHIRAAEPLQKQWKGEPSACWTGARYTESEWILFVGADTWYEPAFLPSLLDYAVSEGLVAMSVFPRQHLPGWLEKVMRPYILGIQFSGVDAVGANNPLNPQTIACGHCFLVRRDAYEFTQGHRAVASSFIQDVALAGLFKRHRMKYRVVRAESMAHSRSRESLGAVWQDLEKQSLKFVTLGLRGGLICALSALVMIAWLPVIGALLVFGHLLAAGLCLFVSGLAWLPWHRQSLPALLVPCAAWLFPILAISGLVKDYFGLRTSGTRRTV